MVAIQLYSNNYNRELCRHFNIKQSRNGCPGTKVADRTDPRKHGAMSWMHTKKSGESLHLIGMNGRVWRAVGLVNKR